MNQDAAEAAEAARLEAVRGLGLLDTAPEPHFDAVCRTAQALFGVPIALVSLVDADRQWFTARCGLALDGTPREAAFCTHAIQSDEVLAVEDARADERFRLSPLVTGAPGIRFYAGAPLTLRPGLRVGTLCLIDTAPRPFTQAQRRQLQDLAAIVVAHLRLHEAEALARAEAERRQQREAALREATDLLRLAQDAAGAGTWDLDLRSGLIRLSPESARLHGLPADREPVVLTTAGWTARLDPDDTGPAWAALQRAVETGSTSAVEFRAARGGGGAPTWLLGLGRVVADAAGRPCRIVGLHLDITARRQAEAALLEGERRSREVLDTANDAFVAVDAVGTITAWNRAAARTFGWTAAEAIGRSLAETIIPPAERARHEAGMGRFLRTGEASVLGRTMELTALHRDGRVLPVEITISTTRAGGSVSFNAFIRDITERRAREEALRESEARHRLLADNASDLIVLGHADGRRSYISPAVTPMLGYSVEEAHRIGMRDWVHPDDLAAVFAATAALSPERPAASVLYRLRRKDGSYIWAEAAFRRAESEAGDVTVVTAIRDVSERQGQAEALRRAKERVDHLLVEAERASQAKSDFLAAMSHEIRTPLNGVLGYADLLREEGGLTSSQARHVERVQQAGSALLTVVDDILDYSQIEAGRVALDPLPFSPRALIDGAVAIVRPLADRKGLALAVHLDTGLPERLVGDEDRLRQVLLNLLNNAVKFTPSGSVALRVDYADCRLVCAVEDTGIGIPDSKRHLLFERFSQVDGSIRREFGGTGLGLAISKRLVGLMGGEIGVRSEPGRGSTFRFSVALPAATPGGEEAEARREPAAADARPARILLAEDVAINQELARRLLERAGHHVDVVSDGAEAVRAVQARAYDLVLMDVQMPVMDGLTATRAIRALDHPASRLPIVAMTANVLPSQVAAFAAAGLDDHVGKPFRPADLCATVARWAGAGDQETPGPDPARAGRSGPVLDAGIYEDLVGIVGRERVDDLLARLAAELRPMFRPGEDEAARGRLAAEAHAMASAAGLLGFTRLSEQCRELEAVCLTGAAPEECLTRLEESRRAVLDEIALRHGAA